MAEAECYSFMSDVSVYRKKSLLSKFHFPSPENQKVAHNGDLCMELIPFPELIGTGIEVTPLVYFCLLQVSIESKFDILS